MFTCFVSSNPRCSPDTAAPADMRTYWVITVKDPGDRGAGVFGYERRFEFGDPEEAFRCAKVAQEAGFEVASARVFATRERLSFTVPR
jgi:hypothetical protein